MRADREPRGKRRRCPVCRFPLPSSVRGTNPCGDCCALMRNLAALHRHQGQQFPRAQRPVRCCPETGE